MSDMQILPNGDEIPLSSNTVYTVPADLKKGKVQLPRHPDFGDTVTFVLPETNVLEKLTIKSRKRIHEDDYDLDCEHHEISYEHHEIEWKGCPTVLSLEFDGHKWRRNEGNGTVSVDYIVVGLGTAGAPLARYLSENMITSVLVLEAGESQITNEAVLQGEPFGNPDLVNDSNVTFQRPADVANIQIPNYIYADGRAWGGSSTIGALIAVRGSPDGYDAWANASGSSQWSYTSLLPVMKFFEAYHPSGTNANTDQRGTNGPLSIVQDPPITDPGETTLYGAASRATNSPLVNDINDPASGDVGIGAEEWYVTPENIRSSAQSAFLPESVVTSGGIGLGSRKLTIKSRATVTEVLFDQTATGPKAMGVRYTLDGKVSMAFAKKKVILSAGTVGTPVILQRSGIGPSNILTPLGIPVIVDNANVGANLQNHYGPVVLLAIDPAKPLGADARPRIGEFDLTGHVEQAYNLGPVSGVRRVQAQFLPGNQILSPADLAKYVINPNVPMMSLVTLNLRPRSTGAVKIQSTDPFSEPLVTFNYYSDTSTPNGVPTDLDIAIRTYKTAAMIQEQYVKETGNESLVILYPPIEYFPPPYGPFKDSSIALLKSTAQNSIAISAHHASGTAQMAKAMDSGVVDSNLDVFGTLGLSCCDASVMPITTGSTAYPVYLLGLMKAKIEGASVPF